MEADLARSEYTDDLMQQYRKHLGGFRYLLLLRVQALIVPARVRQLQQLPNSLFITPVIALYKFSRRVGADKAIRTLLVPAAYHKQVEAMESA